MATKKAEVKHRALGLSDEQALEMYWHILLARRLDERMWILHRQHEIAFTFLASDTKAPRSARSSR